MEFIEKRDNLEIKNGDFIVFEEGILAIVCNNDEKWTLVTLNDGYVLDGLYEGKTLNELRERIIEEGAYVRAIKSENIIIKEF